MSEAAQTQESDTGTTTTTDGSGDAASSQSQNLGDTIAGAAAESSDDSTDSDDSGGTTASEEGGSEGDGDGQPSGAPETYLGFDVPEGFAWSDEDAEPFMESMKGIDATQEQAQKMLETMAAHVNDRVLPDVQKQQDDAYTKLVEQWTQQAKDDPILGGENGELYKPNAALAARVLEMVNQDLKKAGIDTDVISTLLESGDLHRPALMHVLVYAGKRILPDSLGGPGDGGGTSTKWEDTPPEERMGWDDNANPIGHRKSQLE